MEGRISNSATTGSFTENIILTMNENPGPGTYLKHGKATNKTPSHSKRGYGVGFVSKDRRSKALKTTVGPGSAAYSLPSLLTSRKDFNQSNTSSSFQSPIAIQREKSTDQPAPNAYQVNDSLLHKHHGNHGQSAFKSTSKRVDFHKNTSSAPAPCHYNVNDRIVKPSVKVPYSSFKSSTKRDMLQAVPENPGPGEYHPYEAVDPADKTLFPRKHYLCISAPAMPLPPPLPEPGPGSYELVDYRGPPKHYMSSSAFVSTSSRWQGDVKFETDPGPATYRPFTTSRKQSFLYNAQKKWVFP
ncbi:putative O(6)-methylguanine-induced apoptosis 2 [Apostichopus japonicus]|uniref:Putative O(6)-methylguanine-induced apoptosis 2 n=1 Tax=Stichopus japonicus TaxID=307972 RepID=A0A2G8K201_STIJA|nr:putative O(6)-methylguanine-induced apoptosis 2 [Apostichopus japonicus]